MAKRSPRATVLLVDDDRQLGDLARAVFVEEGYSLQSATSGAEAERVFDEHKPDVVLLDLVLPDRDGLVLLDRFKRMNEWTEVVILTGHGGVPEAVKATKNGAFMFVQKPAEVDVLLSVVDRAVEQARLRRDNVDLRSQIEGRVSLKALIGSSAAMLRVLEKVRAVAPSDVNVLITGESGTGKELVANALHRNSTRAKQPFEKINCAAIPKDLIESEMFGHRKGAFTGATTDKVGIFRTADGGSLLLDEIGEMPALLQTKLLRVIQEGEFRPVGSDRAVRTDVRLISTTNIDVRKAIEDGRLREDLYYRIGTVTIRLPPLRDRADDVIALAEHFLATFRKQHRRRRVKGFTREAFDILNRYRWPGNVRELRGAIEYATLMATHEKIAVEDLPEMVSERPQGSSEFSMPVGITLAELEKQAILQTLERTGWNKQEAASRLGLYRPTLYSKMRKHDIVDPTRATRTASKRSR